MALTNFEKEVLARAIDEIREAHRCATMKDCHLYPMDPNGDKKMDDLRELTDLWRSSWILSPLESGLERLDFLAGRGVRSHG